jgi:hypothetical protein
VNSSMPRCISDSQVAHLLGIVRRRHLSCHVFSGRVANSCLSNSSPNRFSTMENSVEEAEDLITCIVCFLEYDEEVSKPKFLACSHSVCSKCLEVSPLVIKTFQVPYLNLTSIFSGNVQRQKIRLPYV